MVGEDASLLDARRATERDKKNIDAWMLYAKEFEKRNCTLEAMDATHRVLELDLNHQEANELLQRLLESQLKTKLENVSLPTGITAEERYLEILSMEPNKLTKEDELNKLQLVVVIVIQNKNLFHLHPMKDQQEDILSNQNYIVQQIPAFNILANVFFQMADYRMSRSCSFIRLHILNTNNSIPESNELKVMALSDLAASYNSPMIGSESEYEIKFLQMAHLLQTDPINPKTWLLSAQLFSKQNKILEAIEAAQRVLELDHTHDEANNLLKLLVDTHLMSIIDKAPADDFADDRERDKTMNLIKQDMLKRVDVNELEKIKMRIIRDLFGMKAVMQQQNNDECKIETLVPQAFAYHFLSTVFYRLSNFSLSLACSFINLHILNSVSEKSDTKNLKIDALCNLAMASYNSQDWDVKCISEYEIKWLDMGYQLEEDKSSVRARIIAAKLFAKRGNLLEAMASTHRILELDMEHREANELLYILLAHQFKAKIESAPPLVSGDEFDINKAFGLVILLKKFVPMDEDKINRLQVGLVKEFIKLNSITVPKENVESRVKTCFDSSNVLAHLCILYNRLCEYQLARSCGFISLHLLNSLSGITIPNVNLKTMKADILSLLADVYISSPYKQINEENFEVKLFQMALNLQTDRESEEAVNLRIRASAAFGNMADHFGQVKELLACLEVCKIKGYKRGYAYSKLYIATSFSNLGNMEAALKFAEEASAEFEKNGDVNGRVLALCLMGEAFGGLKRDDEAIKALEQALSLNRSTRGMVQILIKIGDAYGAQARVFRMNLDSDGELVSLQKAKTYFIDASKHAIKYNLDKLQLHSEILLASIYLDLKSNSTDTGESIATFLEQLLKRASVSKYNSNEIELIYVIYAKYHFQNGEFEMAIDAALKAEMSIKEKKTTQHLQTEETFFPYKNRAVSKTINKILQASYVFTNKATEALLVAIRAKPNDLNNVSEETSNLKFTITVEQIIDAAVVLNSSIIILSDLDGCLFLWLILPNKKFPIKFKCIIYEINQDFQNDKVKIYELPFDNINSRDVSRTFMVPNSQLACTTSDIENATNIFDQVFNKYIELELESCGCTSFIMVPDGDLYVAWFADAKCRDGTPFLNKYTFSVCPSVDMIINPKELYTQAAKPGPSEASNLETSNRVLIVANPQSNIPELPNLPCAIEETRILQELLGDKEDVRVLSEEDAVKPKIANLLSSCRIFHVAAHADLSTDDFQVYRGSIILARFHDSVYYFLNISF